MRLNIKKFGKSIPRLAQIPTINPRLIWQSGSAVTILLVSCVASILISASIIPI